MSTARKNEGTTSRTFDVTNSSAYWNDAGEGTSNFNRIDFELLIPLEGIDNELRWTFSFHMYFFAITFFILTFYTLASIVNIRSQISKKRFMSGINTFLCLFSISRAISLVADPYGSHKNLPYAIMNALWAIGYPSLVSSFCLLQLAFLHLTKLKYGAKILRTEIFLRSVITLHIFSSVLRAVISSMHSSINMVVVNYIFEIIFLSWALFIYTSFLYIGYQVFGLLKRVPATMLQPDGCQNKGIMQLVMLAPASNLVTSVTAALMPTLLGPAASMTSNQIAVSKRSTRINVTDTTTYGVTITPSASVGLDTPGIRKSVFSANVKDAAVIPSCSVEAEITSSTQLKNKDCSKTGLIDAQKDGPLGKTKKLTWQSSITDDSGIGASLNETKISTSVSAYKRPPILKDTNKVGLSTVQKSETDKFHTSSICTLPEDINDQGAQENDLLLHTILNHIAFVNRASGATDNGFAHCTFDATPTSRKKQLGFVLKITYSTAILGLCLTLAEFFQRFGPYGLMRYILNDEEIRSWPWLAFQTFCRACELLMSSAIANITKQPAATVHRYYKHSPAMMKQRRSMFM